MVHISVRDLPSNLTKLERQQYDSYLEYLRVPFDYLSTMLSSDYIYSPFGYYSHKRSTATICHPADFVVLDIDHTNISIHDCKIILRSEQLQCILGTTSDPSNLYRYRVLLPLSESVDPPTYRRLVTGISEFGLLPNIDPASAKPAQPFFSYSGSTVISSPGDQLIVSDYLAEPSIIAPSSADPTELLDDFWEHFRSYSTGTPGNRTKRLLSAGFTMLEHGFTEQQLRWGLTLINNSFLVPKDEQSLHRRVINKLLNIQKGIL